MIKVIHAASWLARRHFYSFSHDLYRNEPAWKEPEMWGGRAVLSPQKNELLRGKHTLLMAVENGRILARVLTGIGAVQQTDGAVEGYFSMFDALPRKDAVQALTDEMCAWHRQMGTRRITGSIAPVPVDLGSGVLYEGFERAAFGDAFNMPYYDEYLRSCGFQCESEWLSYRIDIAHRFDREKYRRASERLCRRFDYHTQVRIAERPRAFAEAVCTVMGISDGREHMNRVIGRLMPFLEPRLCPVTFAGDIPIGFMLTISKRPQPPRIVTLWVHEKWRRKGVTAVLFDSFAQQAADMGIMQTDASLIRADNAASRLSAEYASGEIMHRYRQYTIDI